MEEEADLTKNNTTNTTDTIGKTFPTCEAKHLVDGEEIMPDTTLKTTLPSAILWHIWSRQGRVLEEE